MFSHEIHALLQKHLKQVPQVIASPSFRFDIDDLVAMVFARARLAIVDDANTSTAFGDTVWRALKGRFECRHVTLGPHAAADMETVEDIRRRASQCDVLIAVGSGTVNDLCKYASHLDNKPYAVFPTAASMNGYLSANASITDKGYKKTLPAHMPDAVFCDMSVLAASPVRLSKCGLGDSLARPTAQADWLLSHLLLDTPYDDTPFALLAGLESGLFDNARGVAKGDAASIGLLVQVLLLSGLGMTIAGGSYPASQGEHMIAHAYEMGNASAPHSFHGEQIGVTTRTMAQRQERLLNGSPALALTLFPKEALQGMFGETVTRHAADAYQLKRDAIHDRRLSDEMLRDKWDTVCQRISSIMLPASRIEAVLQSAEAPLLPQDLGWLPDVYKDVSTHARFLRERFTFLDLQFGVA
jgi:glycerol-1-phosphate dehydrogenase [NAD(P)+]